MRKSERRKVNGFTDPKPCHFGLNVWSIASFMHHRLDAQIVPSRQLRGTGPRQAVKQSALCVRAQTAIWTMWIGIMSSTVAQNAQINRVIICGREEAALCGTLPSVAPTANCRSTLVRRIRGRGPVRSDYRKMGLDLPKPTAVRQPESFSVEQQISAFPTLPRR
jgi:hypothetical protein